MILVQDEEDLGSRKMDQSRVYGVITVDGCKFGRHVVLAAGLDTRRRIFKWYTM